MLFRIANRSENTQQAVFQTYNTSNQNTMKEIAQCGPAGDDNESTMQVRLLDIIAQVFVVVVCSCMSFDW
jgi:hypothetical protein